MLLLAVALLDAIASQRLSPTKRFRYHSLAWKVKARLLILVEVMESVNEGL